MSCWKTFEVPWQSSTSISVLGTHQRAVMHSTRSSYMKACSLCFPLLPINIKHKVSYPRKHKHPWESFFPSQTHSQNAQHSCPDTIKTPSQPGWIIIHCVRCCIQKTAHGLHRICVILEHSHGCDHILCGQLHLQHSSGRKLFNSVINNPLIQLHFFLFHFRITISRSSWKSSDRFPMSIRRSRGYQDVLDEPKHSSNSGIEWINPETCQTSPFHRNLPFSRASLPGDIQECEPVCVISQGHHGTVASSCAPVCSRN